jgi:GT2 family glycosyltransferase/glycosyltransferase involved in cell wall biosynthesis
VIPSRNGRELLATLLPGLTSELHGILSEILVVDNGSTDGTREFLAKDYPEVRVIASPEAMSFARAVNCGIDEARFSKTLLLNNDMEVHAGFFRALLHAFEAVPDLFCATAQINFPSGQRREETGKAFLRNRGPKDFPAYCAEPITGEDLSYVLYGSGGCSLYDTAKLRALGRVGEVFEPAYVEDLDLGYRAWRIQWPTVFVAGAKVTHRHRATTSRYFSEQELERVLEVNYLRFLARSVAHPQVFRSLWKQAIDRLNLRAVDGSATSEAALARAGEAQRWVEPVPSARFDERLIVALGSGDVAVFPGRKKRGAPVVLVATPYLPFPLSHGGAVRMFNLMRRTAQEFDQVVVSFCDELGTPPAELLEFCSEIVMVKRVGAHEHPSTDRPDVVEEFSSDAFRAALRQTIAKWKPGVAQLEFTQLAQYAPDCAPAKTVMVEHDVTVDLYAQLLRQSEDWEMRRQLDRWERFETRAWREVDCVVTMSEKDREIVRGARQVVALPNGVDLERFRPSGAAPEHGRLLFIGSFAHLPNVIAVAWFLREVWPLLRELGPRLHIIAGSRHEYFLDLYRSRVELNLAVEGVEVDDFVSDVRPAYERAEVVIAPLQASAGTNIKIMEAMAMEKAIVSTSGGVNGLDVTGGSDFLLANTGADFATAIRELMGNPTRRREIELQARRTAVAKYDWDRIAEAQSELYRQLTERDVEATP